MHSQTLHYPRLHTEVAQAYVDVQMFREALAVLSLVSTPVSGIRDSRVAASDTDMEVATSHGPSVPIDGLTAPEYVGSWHYRYSTSCIHTIRRVDDHVFSGCFYPTMTWKSSVSSGCCRLAAILNWAWQPCSPPPLLHQSRQVLVVREAPPLQGHLISQRGWLTC